MNALRVLLSILIMVVFSGLTTGTQAQDQTAMRGVYVLEAETSDDLEQAIRTYTSRMTRLTGMFARRLIRNTNRPYTWIRIDIGDGRVSVTTPNREPILTDADGTETEWTRDEDRKTFTVHTRWRNGRLHQVFANEDGQRANVYTLHDDGETLHMDVTLTSPRPDLPDPMTYRMVYRRNR